jgi:perosamine synthetase
MRDIPLSGIHPQWANQMLSEVLRGGPEVADVLKEEWQRLCDEPGNNLPFNHPDWVSPYFQCSTGPWVFFALRRQGRLISLLPLIEKKTRISHLPATVLRAPSDFHLWPFDLPVAPEMDRPEVARELWSLIKETRSWDIVEVPNVPQGGFGEELSAAATSDGFPTYRWEYMHSPYIPLEGRRAEDDPLSLARSRNLRQTIRKVLRRIEREGGRRTWRVTYPDRRVLDALYRLEIESWKGEQGTAIASRDKDRRFFEAILAAAARNNALSLNCMEFNGRIVAVIAGLNYKKNYYCFKMGWDVSLKPYSLGHLLVLDVLKDQIKQGASVVLMMGLSAAWKTQWTDRFIPHATHYIFREGLYGRLLKIGKLRQVAQLDTSLPHRQSRIENAGTHNDTKPIHPATAPRTFFAPTAPGLGIHHLVLNRAAFSHYPFNMTSMEHFYNARSAIYTLAGAFGLNGEEVLFPSYCCGVDLEALLSAGVVPKFYPVKDTMRIDISEIASRLSSATKAVYVIHYLGFPSPVDELAALCRGRGIRLIEDCALSLFSKLGTRPLGSFGDAAVFSLYKSLPVPSGGLLVFNDGNQRKLGPRRRPPLRTTLSHLRLLVERNFDMKGNQWAKRLSTAVRGAVKSVKPSLEKTPVIEVLTERFDPEVCLLRMSRVSDWVLRSVDPEYIIQRRRENFTALHRQLAGRVQPVFDHLPEGVCPLFYAIKVGDNRLLMKALREGGVEAWAWWWPTHPKLLESRCAEAQRLRGQVVVIPCHEGISPNGINRVVQAVIKALQKTGCKNADRENRTGRRVTRKGGYAASS